MISESAPSWGWNPDTFSAVGTVASTVVAAFAALLAVSQQVGLRRDRLRAQAGLFTAVIVGWVKSGDSSEPDEITISIHNGSTQPIYQLAVVVRHTVKPADGGWPVVLPGFNGSWWGGASRGHDNRDVLSLETVELRPDQTAKIHLRVRTALTHFPLRNSVAVSFTDSFGHTWSRDLNGYLTRGWRQSVGQRQRVRKGLL